MPNRTASRTTASRTYGTVTAERRKEMSGLEFVQGLADGTLPLNTIAQTLGYDVAEAVSGRVVVTAEPSGIHLNPAGTVHGGFAATLLDSCMGLAVQSTLEQGIGQTTLEFKISLVRPITPETGEIRAEGIVLSRGRQSWHRRRTDHGSRGAFARPWHDHLPDLRELIVHRETATHAHGKDKLTNDQCFHEECGPQAWLHWKSPMSAKPPETFNLDRLPTPIGTALLVTDGDGVLCALDCRRYEPRMKGLLRLQYGAVTLGNARASAEIRTALTDYFKGDLDRLNAIKWRVAGTPFQRKIWNALPGIPAGITMSYGALAAKLGMPQAMRAVGHANGSNPISVVVPCHRLIGANGSLVKYGGGLRAQALASARTRVWRFRALNSRSCRFRGHFPSLFSPTGSAGWAPDDRLASRTECSDVHEHAVRKVHNPTATASPGQAGRNDGSGLRIRNRSARHSSPRWRADEAARS